MMIFFLKWKRGLNFQKIYTNQMLYISPFTKACYRSKNQMIIHLKHRPPRKMICTDLLFHREKKKKKTITFKEIKEQQRSRTRTKLHTKDLGGKKKNYNHVMDLSCNIHLIIPLSSSNGRDLWRWVSWIGAQGPSLEFQQALLVQYTSLLRTVSLGFWEMQALEVLPLELFGLLPLLPAHSYVSQWTMISNNPCQISKILWLLHIFWTRWVH